jgi:hypothetical protein
MSLAPARFSGAISGRGFRRSLHVKLQFKLQFRDGLLNAFTTPHFGQPTNVVSSAPPVISVRIEGHFPMNANLLTTRLTALLLGGFLFAATAAAQGSEYLVVKYRSNYFSGYYLSYAPTTTPWAPSVERWASARLASVSLTGAIQWISVL